MASTIQIILEKGVIACTKRQKQTALGLGLKHRHQVKTLKDTAAIRGMVSKISHLASIVKQVPQLNPWQGLPAEYELGAKKAKIEKAPKKVAVKASAEEAKNSVKAAGKTAAKASKTKKDTENKKSKTTKKVKS